MQVLSGLVHVLGHVAPVERQWNAYKKRATMDYTWATGVHGTACCFDRSAQTWVTADSSSQSQPGAEISVSHTVALASRMNAVVLRLDASFVLLRYKLLWMQDKCCASCVALQLYMITSQTGFAAAPGPSV
jgi:hypothetical protein